MYNVHVNNGKKLVKTIALEQHSLPASPEVYLC